MCNSKQFTPRSVLAPLATTSLLAALASPAMAEETASVITPDSSRLEWGPCPDFMPEGCAIAVLHGNPAEPNADVLFKVPGHSEIPTHWHHSAERMILISGEMKIQYEDQEAAIVHTSDYAYGPPQRAHSARCNSADDCVLFIAFTKPVDAMPAGK